MTVIELISKLQDCDPDALVYVDWDREGGNECVATEIDQAFTDNAYGIPGVKIK